MDFDPVLVSQLNEKKIMSPGSPASFLLSETKLRHIIENAREIVKVGSSLSSSSQLALNFRHFRLEKSLFCLGLFSLALLLIIEFLSEVLD